MAEDAAKRQVTRRCHWVPQAYLKSFAADDTAGQKVWQLSKDEGKPELKLIKKVAVRHHLYVPKNALGQRDDSFEKKLAELEAWFATDIWATLCHGIVDFEPVEVRKLVALLSATMWLRTPRHLDMQHSMHAQIVAAFSSQAGIPDRVKIGGKVMHLDVASWPSFRDASEDDLKRAWITELNNATHYAKILMTMRWSVIFAEGPAFITTDSPVACVHPSGRFHGLKNPKTQMMFPLSPKRLLVMDWCLDEPDGLYYPLVGSPAPLNILLWREAIGHMFSSRHPHLVCAELVEHAEQVGVTQRI